MLKHGIGWDLVNDLHESHCEFKPFLSFIYVYQIYSCGHEDYFGSFDLEDFKAIFGDEDISYSIYIDDDNTLDCIDVKVWMDDECDECMYQEDDHRIYCDECIPPTGFEKVTKYHGIAAYNVAGLDTVGDYLVRFQSINANPEWQICCSSRPIGNIGAVIDGDVLCASNMDLYTDIDPDNGRRYFDGSRYRATHLVSDASELDSTVWSHDEIVTHNNSIRYIWVYDQASDTIKNYGKFLARILKVYYVEVSNALEV